MPNWGSAHNYCPFQGRTNQGMPWNSFNLSYPHIDKHRGRRLSLSRPPHGGITRLTDSGSSAASLYTKTNRSGRGGGTEQSRRNCWIKQSCVSNNFVGKQGWRVVHGSRDKLVRNKTNIVVFWLKGTPLKLRPPQYNTRTVDKRKRAALHTGS
jgi:hypothetical protein